MFSNTEDFFNLFLIVSAIHGFIFSGILLFTKYGRTRSIVFLNLFTWGKYKIILGLGTNFPVFTFYLLLSVI